jgi:hypothetical protein
MAGLKRLKRLPKLSSLKSLPSLTGERRKDSKPDPYVSQEHTSFDSTDDTEDRLARELKSRAMAKKVLGLKKEYPYGTVPELLAMDWLRTNRERYVWQAQLYGGFRSGGIVPDFLVHRNSSITALLVQGNYWHNLPGMKTADESDRQRLLGTSYEGQRIKKVVFVWETRLMRSRDDVMRHALSGIELGP